METNKTIVLDGGKQRYGGTKMQISWLTVARMITNDPRLFIKARDEQVVQLEMTDAGLLITVERK